MWERPSWFDQGLCNKAGFDLFFTAPSDPKGRGSRAWEDDAKALCEQCPVKMKCQRQGFFETEGVWGGWNEDDRHEVRMEYRRYKGIPPMVRLDDLDEQLTRELYG